MSLPLNKSHMKSIPQLSWVLAWVGVMLCALLVIYPLSDFDTFWHLSNGRAMLEQHRVISKEVFSYTANGAPFENHAWLAQVIFEWIVEAFGLPGLTIFKALLVAVMVGLTYRTMRLYQVGSAVATLLTVWLVFASIYLLTERPNLFSLLFLALLAYLIESFRTGRHSARWLWILPPLFVVWDFLHGSVYGLVMLCAYVLGMSSTELARLQWKWLALMQVDKLRSLWIVVVVVLAAVAANPYGLLEYRFFADLVNGNALASMVGEFQRTPFIAAFVPFWITLGLAAWVALVGLRRKDFLPVAILLPFAYLAVRYSRATAPFMVLAVPLLAPWLNTSLQRVLGNARVQPFAKPVLTVIFVALAGYVAHYKFGEPRHVNSFGFGINPDFHPVAALKFLDANRVGGNQFNSGELGGYIAYAAPHRKIFLYNHHQVFDVLTQSLWQPQALSRWNINYALLGYNWQRYRHLFPLEEWAVVYWEPATMVMLRRSAANRPIIAAHEIEYFSPQLSGEQVSAMARDPRVFPKLMSELADYLTYREDAEIAQVFATLIVIPHDQVDQTQRAQWVEQVLRGNPKAQLTRPE